MEKKLGVLGVVFNTSHTKLLLIHRRDVSIWALPGGGVDPGEKPEDAVIREIKEETGLDAKIIRQGALFTPINRLTQETYLFVCESTEGTPITSEETRAAAFFPLDAFPPSFLFIHRQWLQEILANPTTVVCRPLTEITYWKLFKYFFLHPIMVIRALLSRWKMPINS
jgi:8-oxo-dGTP diphosphatase